MNSRIITVLLTGLLMVTGLDAQEIGTSSAEGERLLDVQGGLVAPETPMLVLHVPISLQALATDVGAWVHCEVVVNRPDSPGVLSVFRARGLPLIDRAYQGVVSFYFEETLGVYNTGYRAEDLQSYTCTLLLCATGVSGGNKYEGAPNSCAMPAIPANEGGTVTVVGSDADAIRPDPDFPITVFVVGGLQQD